MVGQLTDSKITETKRVLDKKAHILPSIDGTVNLLTLFQAHIPQLCTAFTECEIFKIEKPNLIKLLTLCKDEIYPNNDRCFRVFLLVMKFLSDTNATKIFNTFYDNKMFIQLSDFYINWVKRCGDNHNVIRSILIKAEKMDAKPKWTISIWRRQFVIKEEELILSNNNSNNIPSTTIIETTDSLVYQWDKQLQADLMNNMKTPNFIKIYDKKMPPFNSTFDKLSFPEQTSNGSLNFICSIRNIPNRYFILKIRPKHQSYWEAYIYQYVEEKLRLISGIIRIYHCLSFTDKCLTVQEFTAGTLKELIAIQDYSSIKLSEFIIAIIILDLMKILRCIHQMNIIHGCFKSHNIFVAGRIAYKPQLNTLTNGATLLVKLANWDSAIQNTNGRKHSGQYINENNIVTDDNYKCGPQNYEIDKIGFVNIVNELISNQSLHYLQCKNGRYVSLLNFEKNLYMHELWSNLFHKCLNMKLCNWDELINIFAETVDTSIRENGDQWIRLSAEYNVLLLELFKKKSKFYP